MNPTLLRRLARRDPRQALMLLTEEAHRLEVRQKAESHMDFATQLMKKVYDVRRKTQL